MEFPSMLDRVREADQAYFAMRDAPVSAAIKKATLAKLLQEQQTEAENQKLMQLLSPEQRLAVKGGAKLSDVLDIGGERGRAETLRGAIPFIMSESRPEDVRGHLLNVQAQFGTPAEQKEALTSLTEVPKAEPTKRSSYAQQLIDEGLNPNDPKTAPEFYRRMREYNLAEAGGKGKGISVTNVMPGSEKPIDIPKFRDQVQQTIKPYITTADAADTSLVMVKQAIDTGNPTSFQGARVQLAKAFGDSQITSREIQAAGGDPSIWGSLIDTGSTLFTGTPSADTMKSMEKTLIAIKKVASKKASDEIARQKKIAKYSGIKDEASNLIFDFPQFNEQQPSNIPITETRTLSSGKKVTVTVRP